MHGRPPAPRSSAAPRLARVLREELGALELRRIAAHAACALLPDSTLGRVRTSVLRACGARFGTGTIVNGAVRFHGPRGAMGRLTVGSHCFFTTPLFLDLTGTIVVGDRVTIGHHVRVVTSHHDIGGPERRCATLRPDAVRIEDGCWIGAAALILPGVTLGRGSVVAAGALVHRDVAPGTLVAGVPARLVRELHGP